MKQKIDLSVQSYKKPESLLYTLMCLKECSGHHIDTLYINDDCSGDDLEGIYLNDKVKDYFSDWNIKVRVNTRPVRWYRAFVNGYRPSYLSVKKFLNHKFLDLFRKEKLFHIQEDIRYQWAINSTDKHYLFIIHDDIEFYDDIVGFYLDNITDNCAVIGELGQCWRCIFAEANPPCNPEKIMKSIYPSKNWPLTVDKSSGHKRACRINEWCCLINVEAVKCITEKERCFFGNYDDDGDVGAYWFEQVVKHGYNFVDPLPTYEERNKYYRHPWQGHSGHSVWQEQDGNMNVYNREFVIKRMIERFGVDLTDRA